MKKLMIALAVAAMAVASHAASFSWTTSTQTIGVDLDSLNGNTTISADGAVLTKTTAAFTGILIAYTAGTQTEVGRSSSVNLQWGYSGTKSIKAAFTIAEVSTGTTYDFVVKITGTQNDMSTYKTATWDYTKATLAADATVSQEVSSKGATNLSTTSPSAWTVSGATKIEDVPEPTSGLLLLLGVAGLALKRKQK